MGVVKKMAKNTASLSTAKVISLACSVVFSIFAARYLGELQYGTYAFIMVLITYFMVTSEYGLENLLVRDVADNKEKAIEYIASTLAIKILTSLLSLAMLIVVLLIMKRQDIVAVSFWAGLSLIPYALYMAIDAAFRAHEEMHYIAIIDIIYFVMRSAIGILVVINTTDLTQLFRAFLVVEVLRLVLGVIIYRNNVGRLSVKVNVSLFKYLIKDGFSMAYWKMLAILYKKVDMLILSVMIGDIAVGWFKIARNITDMITIGSVIIMNVLMPVMTVMYANSKIDFKDAYNTIFKYIVIVMIPVAVLIANYSDKIILSLYGEQYQNSVFILQLLMTVAVIDFLLALIGTTLIIIDRFKLAAKISIFTVAVKIILSIVLIKNYGYIGACYAAIIVSAMSMIIYIPVVYVTIGKTGLEKYGMKLLAVLAVISFIFVILKGVSMIDTTILIPIFVLIYLVTLIRLQVITLKDLTLFRREV